MGSQKNLESLVELGLTSLESEVYAYLVANSPASGYKVAKGIAKPAANVYKAIESLQAKGALLVEDSQTRLCRAVPAAELLAGLERRFKDLRSQAEVELGRLQASPSDQRVYQLHTPEQVLTRFGHMLAGCKRVAMLDLFPLAVERLKPEIAAAAHRGVSITLKVYMPLQIPGVKVAVAPHGPTVLRKWSGQWANGVVDGREYLVAYLSADGASVNQAMWSCSPVLSMIYYQGFVRELAMDAIETELAQGADINAIRRIADELRASMAMKSAGYVPEPDDTDGTPRE
jgi:HTH-type transcriptional regulator, sugar sensing transcriptional regulator